MEKNNFLDELERCTHGQESPCGCACPFSFPVRDFIDKIRRGSFGAAFRLYRNAVVFPDLVWRLCPAPCGEACKKTLNGTPVFLPLLERAAAEFARSTDPIRYNLPKKTKRAAVVGAGPAELACALRLAEKGYPVTVYEQSGRLGGAFLEVLSPEIVEREIQKQFQYTACVFVKDTRISRIEELDAEAAYLCTESGIEAKGEGALVCPGGKNPVESIAEGIRAAGEIEWYLQTGAWKNRKQQEADGSRPGPGEERAADVTKGDFLRIATEKERGEGSRAEERERWEAAWSKEQAKAEAERCTRCDCTACMDACVLLRQYGSPPKDLEKDVKLSLNIFPETQGRAAMREIGSCNNCNLCGKLCPSGIRIGDFLLQARTDLCSSGILPPAHHEYWLRDMEFSNSEEVSMFYQPEETASDYLFFPGCQAGGSDPRYVSLTYERLLARYPKTSLLLRCCGAPALWAGEEAAFGRELEQITLYWREAGKPAVILACPTCHRIFREYLPEIPVKMVYDLPEIWTGMASPFEEASVFDPCASRDYPKMQAAVREMAAECGVRLKELPYSGEKAQCCSWGGHGYVVNPLFVKTQVREQISQSGLPYLTYCTNCRDIFSIQGKECRHILDLLLGINFENREVPTITKRRENRRKLKRELAECYLSGTLLFENSGKQENNILTMTKELSRKLSENLILEEDICRVIEDCEKKGRYLLDAESGHRIGHLKIGLLTYWAEYGEGEGGLYSLYGAYSHRMAIQGEDEAG
ncbi:heterodisulfide reductase-related iron-sulfur binding cluster [Cuneatibacter sp. NSJ-177]|uniref:pyridine nucleotide-disulfide oxidoreductase/dicluster-binding protein n=1 Tax=Cuneatibacter sp. NSJ-177 TaxID=2931401 RepID=UPI001FCFD63C|nr:pyridine nucleotide-disulfide oxidoreductase/dicluster-binding protein [Cuneatibacter sp. NSJ-177]MCJ7836609.1 heterodisulfide reductase-related iron-sulfur binding cluster [Cuneatibacter sp. NSJ-177]